MDPNVERQIKWDQRYMGLARLIAGWSKDPSTKVGAVLVRPNNSVAATGYNGFKPGADDDPELYQDPEYKAKHIVHAETNCVNFYYADIAKTRLENKTKDGLRLEGFTIYSSFPVCPVCMGMLGQYRLSRVVQPPLPVEGKDTDWIRRWTGNVVRAKAVAQSHRIELVTIGRG